MTIAIVKEYDLKNGEESLDEYRKVSARALEYWQRQRQEGFINNISIWSDKTRHFIAWVDIPSEEAFQRIWADQNFHAMKDAFASAVQNIKIQVYKRLIPPS